MILSKSDYLEKMNSLLQDNSTQLISPQDLRISLRDLVDSVHLFTDGSEIVSANFATPDTRTTIAGELALGKLKFAGRSSVDNSAFGYYALGANYDGEKNTAVGSHSLGCSLRGDYNTAVGFNSIAGTTTGSGNTAIGSLSLQSLRTGSFNIAIGHGAGSHIPTGENYKFYLGIDPIDSDYTCPDLAEVSGALPLLYGDTLDRKLAIGIRNLHGYGALQVSGDIAPSHNDSFNLGNSNFSWESINEKVYFSGGYVGIGTSAPSGNQGLVTVNGNIVPSEDGSYSLGYDDGTNRLLWDGYFNDVVVSGRFYCNDINIVEVDVCSYDCKTLHLASSGLCGDDLLGDAFCGFLTDEGLDGAGLEVHSSGYDYRRDYKLLFRNADPNITCLEQDTHYSRSRWQSNISIEVTSGNHFQGNRLLGDESVSIIKQSGCYGVFSTSQHPSGDRLFISREDHVDAYQSPADINFISNSGTHIDAVTGNPSGYDYTVSYGTVDSGVKITQQFASRIKTSSGKRGFSIVYHDESDT